MPSPICTINGNSTIDGYNTVPGAIVNIALADKTDVNYWSLTCYSTDDKQTIAGINAAIAVDQINKTATLNIPYTARGCAIILKSIVNNGDLNGVIMPSYTTTFGIFARGGAGMRLIAANQTAEGDANFGWIKDLNMLLGGEMPRKPDLGSNTITITDILSCNDLTTSNLGYNDIAGGIRGAVYKHSAIADYHCDVDAGTDFCVLCNSVVPPSTPINVYLPTPTAGRLISIINLSDLANFHIHPFASEKINHSASPYALAHYLGVLLISNGTDWFLTTRTS